MRRLTALLMLGILFTLPACGAQRAVGNLLSGGPDYFKDKRLVCSGKVERIIDGNFGRRWIGVEEDRLLRKKGMYTIFGHEAPDYDTVDLLGSQMQAEVVALNPEVVIDDLGAGETYYAPKECHLIKIKDPDEVKPKKNN